MVIAKNVPKIFCLKRHPTARVYLKYPPAQRNDNAHPDPRGDRDSPLNGRSNDNANIYEAYCTVSGTNYSN